MRRVWTAWVLAILGFGAWMQPVAAWGARNPMLTGQVTGVLGRPLSGAEVEIFKFGAGQVASVSTDGEGNFHYRIPDDTAVYWFRTWAQGYRSAEGSWTSGQGSNFVALALDTMETELTVRAVDPRTGLGIPGATFEVRRKESGPVELLSGDDTGVVHTHLSASGGFSILAWAPGRIPVLHAVDKTNVGTTWNLTLKMKSAVGVVKGTAVNATGIQLKGAAVQIVSKGNGIVATSETDSQGNFSVTIPSGSDYQVVVQLDGYAPGVTDFFSVASGETRDLSGDRQLILRQPRAIISGGLRDPHGRPLSGQTIWLYGKSVGAISSTITDSEGGFVFQDIPTRSDLEYRVQALPVDASWRAATSPWLQLKAGQTMVTALRLEHGMVGNRSPSGAVVGTVMDERDLPVTGVDIQLWREGFGLVQSTTSGSDGTFKFSSVGANAGTYEWEQPYNGYFLRANAAGMREEVFASEGLLNVLPGQDTVVSLAAHHRSLSLSGQVIADNGVPIAGAKVVLTPADGGGVPIVVASDFDGRWQFGQTDPLVDYTLYASHPGYLAILSSGFIKSGSQSGDTTIQLRAANTLISGFVSSLRGEPLANVPVQAWGPTGVYRAATGRDGHYSVEVPSGLPYVVSVVSENRTAASVMAPSSPSGDFQQTTPTSTLGREEWIEASFRISAADGTITGTAFSTDWQPIPGTAVELVREGHGVVMTTLTDSKGRYSFVKVPANYRHEVRPKGKDYSYVGTKLPRLFTVMPETTSFIHIQIGPNQDPTG